MTLSLHESAVSLDKLDDHLKALLRLKIREFVHLSPWFKEVPNTFTTPVVDPTLMPPPPPQFVDAPKVRVRRHASNACPNRKLDGKVGRRHVRATVHVI